MSTDQLLYGIFKLTNEYNIFFFNCNFFYLLNSSASLWFWVCSTMLTGSPCCTCNGNLISINWIWMNEATNEYIILLGASARPFKNHFRLSARRRNNMQLKPFDLLPPPIKTSERVLWGLRRSARGFEHDLTSPSTRKQPVNHKNNRYTASLFSFLSHKISLDIYSTFSLAAACKKKTIFGEKKQWNSRGLPYFHRGYAPLTVSRKSLPPCSYFLSRPGEIQLVAKRASGSLRVSLGFLKTQTTKLICVSVPALSLSVSLSPL